MPFIHAARDTHGGIENGFGGLVGALVPDLDLGQPLTSLRPISAWRNLMAKESSDPWVMLKRCVRMVL